ncbi:PorT family protein [Chryseobacterium sp. MEBOG06]|uniref:outer membrane beta-barrel protein n=1 Tax=Chryseobacterium sp. MEBOG06 TaxID=2879938 RepID=UPI001F3DBF0F|nr:outer membrane beta-barrel protein [Chryseobacterium sp. MEBOG06]UKB82796.1 PorT family protein [Chryseobacterium sp. MEBOG06]
MKNFFYAALILFPSLFYSQINFEQGYIINQKGEKINGLIKNYDWRNNPTIIEYKQTENDKTENLQTIDLNEFSVGSIKYIKAKVLIDRSSSNLQSLSGTKDLNSKEEVLLLKTLVDGKISLYKYNDQYVTRYFYKKENEDTFNQLEYKEYLESDRLIKNEQYKHQLKKEFSDNGNITSSDIERLVYKENDLKKIFLNYNGLEDVNDKNKNDFHIYLKPGVGFSSYKILTPSNDNTINEYKKNSIAYRFGVELEYVLSFNKGKWALISEPTFQSVNYKINDYNDKNFEIKYSSIQIPLGIKYNIFLNQKSKIYVVGSIFYDLILNNSKVFTVDNNSFSGGDSAFYMTFGAGYNYDKFGVEFKWGNVPTFSSAYYGHAGEINMNGVNISLSYKIF